MILPISWVRVFSFKPRKLSIVIDLVVANKRFGFGSAWLQNSCQSHYTSLPSEPSLQEKTLPILFFFIKDERTSDVEGLESGQESWLAHASEALSLDLKASVSLLAMSWEESHHFIWLGLPCFLEVLQCMRASQYVEVDMVLHTRDCIAGCWPASCAVVGP